MVWVLPEGPYRGKVESSESFSCGLEGPRLVENYSEDRGNQILNGGKIFWYI